MAKPLFMQNRLLLLLVAIISIPLFSQEKVNLSIMPDIIEKKVDEKIYGVLMEHIYHSVSNGLWGETVWNRSFEELLAHGKWEVNNEALIQINAINNDNCLFHIAKAENFELSLQFRRTMGNGSVIIGLRDQYRELMPTNSIYCYLGTGDNRSCDLVANTGWIWHTPIIQTQVVESLAKAIDNNKWYDLNIKCRDNHIQVWLDKNKIFDQIIENAPKNGAIRIGADNSFVEFKDIIINSTENKKIPLALNPVRHWQFIGKGSISAITDNVLNHNTAVKIKAVEKNTGIEQVSNFNIRKDDPLKGSIYLRGNIKNASVQLIYKNKILAEQLISNITGNWNEYKLYLKAKENCDNATLRVISLDEGDLYIDQVSLMHQSSIENDGYRKDIYDAVKELKPSVIRWPGGSFVELYDFENGIGKQKDRKGKLRWDDFDPLSFGTDEFINFCRKIKAEPLIVLPIGYHNYDGYSPDKNGQTDWLKKAQEWLEYCNGDQTTEWGAKRAANGHPEPYNVKYWEIDNEVWKMDPKVYSHLVRIFSQTLKRQDPSIKIIGCGSGRLGKEGIGLDSILIKTSAEYIDYISPHHYMDVEKYGNGGIEEYKLYLQKLEKWISESSNPKMKIYVSEWNLDKTDMRTGLFAGGILNLFESMSSVEMAACALLLRHTSATGWNNAFINFNQNGWYAAPNYIVMKLWREHYASNLISMKGDLKGLNIITTKSEDGTTIYIKVVNPSEKEYDINLNISQTFIPGSAKISRVATSDLTISNDMEEKERIRVVEKELIPNRNKINTVICKYSASVITIKCKK